MAAIFLSDSNYGSADPSRDRTAAKAGVQFSKIPFHSISLLIFKSLLNDVLPFILVALIQSPKGMAIAQVIVSPIPSYYTISVIMGRLIG